MIGEVSLIWRDAPSRQAEIGYIFHPDFHGQGYASEAAQALLRWASRAPGCTASTPAATRATARSWRVMERLGMRREAHFREHVFVKGAWDEEFDLRHARGRMAGRRRTAKSRLRRLCEIRVQRRRIWQDISMR